MSDNKHKWARKVGFGFGPNELLPTDVESWNNSQLTSNFKSVGVAKRYSDVEIWPQEYNFSFEDRLRRAGEYNEGKKEIENSKKLTSVEKKKRVRTLRDQTDVALFDVYKFWNSAIYGDDMVKQRLTHFWTNHFTVGGGGRRNYIIGDFIYRVIYGNLNASFDELLYKVTTHVGMLDYLDNAESVGERSESARWARRNGKTQGLNDNLARELLELHSVSPERMYTEDDIRNSAKILAGWGANTDSVIRKFYRERRRDNPAIGSLGKFIYEPYFKDRAEPGRKIVLDNKFRSGKKSLRQLTDMLANDDFTARHLSKKLAIHFIGESVNQSEIDFIYNVWKDSKGNLEEIHKEVLNVTARSKERKFLWPSTWMFQAIRFSGSSFLPGFEDGNASFYKAVPSKLNYEPKKILEELGNSFWESRQPDGYSERKDDWISTEHFDRRIKVASRIHDFQPDREGEEIATLLGFSDNTKIAIDKASNMRDKFIVALCSPDFMEV